MARGADGHDRRMARQRRPATARQRTVYDAAVQGDKLAQELRLQELSSHLLFHAKGLLRQRGMALEQMRETLAASAGNFLARQASRLGNAAELVAGRSPERILRLGFAIVRTDGKAVFSAAQVGKGDTLDIEVADGRIEGTVQYTETK